MEIKSVRLLVDFDALFDTRIATIARMDEALALEVLKGNYYRRRSEYFPGVDKAAFDAAYALRDNATLREAHITNVVFVLQEQCQAILAQAGELPHHQTVEVTLNTFPYTLGAEAQTAIKAALRVWIGDLPQIHVIRVDPKELTPQQVEVGYDGLYFYHYAEWLEAHADAFATTHLMRVKLYVPAISFTRELTDQELREASVYGEHPIRLLQLGAARYIDLQPLDVSAFCLINPSKL